LNRKVGKNTFQTIFNRKIAKIAKNISNPNQFIFNRKIGKNGKEDIGEGHTFLAPN